MEPAQHLLTSNMPSCLAAGRYQYDNTALRPCRRRPEGSRGALDSGEGAKSRAKRLAGATFGHEHCLLEQCTRRDAGTIWVRLELAHQRLERVGRDVEVLIVEAEVFGVDPEHGRLEATRRIRPRPVGKPAHPACVLEGGRDRRRVVRAGWTGPAPDVDAPGAQRLPDGRPPI